MPLAEKVGQLFMLAFALLTAIASYGYGWRKIVGFGKFWYLLLAVALVTVAYEGMQLIRLQMYQVV